MLRIGISKVVLDKVVSAMIEDSLTIVRSLRNSPVTSRGTTSTQLFCKILYLRYGISWDIIMFYEWLIITLIKQLRQYNRKEKLQRKGLVSQTQEMRISYWLSWNEVEKRTWKREEKKIDNWVLYKNFKTQCIRQNRKKLKKTTLQKLYEKMMISVRTEVKREMESFLNVYVVGLEDGRYFERVCQSERGHRPSPCRSTYSTPHRLTDTMTPS